MNNSINIRLVRKADAGSMLEIYGPIVTNTATSFEVGIPTIEEFEKRISTYASKAPWLVAEINGKLVGYAYATDHRSREAYQWNQEVTVYVHQDYRKVGIARKLYLMLFEVLKSMNFCKLIAVITLPNEPSIGFHKALGFNHIGEMKNIGYKIDKWHSTSWWDLDLNDRHDKPKEITPLDSILSQFNLSQE